MNYLLALHYFLKLRYFEKFKDRKELTKYQNRKIKKHLAFLKKNSQYYKQLEGKPLENYEIVNKKIMMDNFDSINTVNANKEECMKIAIESEHTRDFSPKYQKYTVGLSSGTSGHRGLFLLSDKEIMQWAGAILARVLPPKHLLGNRIAFFLRADNNLYESINSIFVKFEFFDLIKDMSENIERLIEYNPTILVAPASILKELAIVIEKRKINSINPIKIISVAEVLTKTDERYIKSVFKKDIIHQVYQCTEGFLGYTCECGNMHLNEDIIKVEKEVIDENRFIPIITDYYRKTQPIIRYRLNDVLISSNKKCECGSQFIVIDQIEGREDDIFIFDSLDKSDEVKVHGDFISRCLIYVDDIINYKVFQKSKDSIIVFIDNISEKTKNDILEQFRLLSEKMKFIMPSISFESYKKEKTKKMKRIERGF
jgi:putative adenylate-forming enzyme